jgi:hypothetical protein
MLAEFVGVVKQRDQAAKEIIEGLGKEFGFHEIPP